MVPPVIWYPCTESLAISRYNYIYPFLAARYGRACGDGRNERCWTYYTGLEGTDLAGPSSGGEGTSVACAGACSVEVGVGRPSSRVGEETGSALEDIPGTGGEETTAEIAAVDSLLMAMRVWPLFLHL